MKFGEFKKIIEHLRIEYSTYIETCLEGDELNMRTPITGMHIDKDENHLILQQSSYHRTDGAPLRIKHLWKIDNKTRSFYMGIQLSTMTVDELLERATEEEVSDDMLITIGNTHLAPDGPTCCGWDDDGKITLAVMDYNNVLVLIFTNSADESVY